MHISSGSQLDAIQCFGCTFVPHFVRPTETAECLLLACAVKRRRFPVGASPTRQPLQPEAIGAVTEVTKWLKPSISVSRIGDSASVRRASLEKDNAQADPTAISGKADTAG